jgi:hypothetical protein
LLLLLSLGILLDVSCVISAPAVTRLTVRHSPTIDATWLTSFTLTVKKTNRAKALAAFGLTPPEAALFVAVYHGLTAPPANMPSIAAAEDYNPDGAKVTEEECRVALAACFAKGWLRVLDDAALARIVDELRAGGFLGPIYGLPEVEGVDFTPAGAELWQRFCDWRRPDVRRSSVFTDVVHCKYSRFFRTEAAALTGIAEIRNPDDPVSITGPSPIGPWRVQWWRRFPKGYRIDVEERMHWQGRCGHGEGCFLDCSRWKSDPPRLQRVLDCHNITPAEWLMLAVMDVLSQRSVSHLPRWAAESADQLFGVKTSEKKCRTALETCLRYGWLRVVDRYAVDEVYALLGRDRVMLAVPRDVESSWGEIDFTPAGATLYRMIAAEWLGPDWEDDLQVWKESYREEHQYCQTEEGFQRNEQYRPPRREVVQSSKVAPVGPWCVYWWERFPSGYRLERKIGEP